MERLEPRVCLTCPPGLPAATVCAAFDYDIIARPGAGGLTSIEPAVSISDNGRVAFVGDTATGRSLFIGGGRGPLTDIAPTRVAGRTFRPNVEINNLMQVAAVDFTAGAPDEWNARIWEASSPDSSNVIARASSPSSHSTHFDSIFSSVALNHDGRMAFAAQDGTALELHHRDALVEDGLTTVAVESFSSAQTVDPANTDKGEALFHWENSQTGSETITLFRPSVGAFFSETAIASTSGATWDDLGQRPGISDDGNLIVFYGDLTAAGADELNAEQPNHFDRLAAGPGIFVSITTADGRVIQRIAEIDPAAGFTSFNADTRVGVGTVKADQPYASIVFMATAGGRDGIYSSRINVLPRDGGVVVTDPLVVIEEGAIVFDDGDGDGRWDAGENRLAGVVDQLAISDPVNSRGLGQVAFWTQTTTGDQGIVVADPWFDSPLVDQVIRNSRQPARGSGNANNDINQIILHGVVGTELSLNQKVVNTTIGPHYGVGRQGRLTQFVQEDKRANHAQDRVVAANRHRTNDWSIGIELVDDCVLPVGQNECNVGTGHREPTSGWATDDLLEMTALLTHDIGARNSVPLVHPVPDPYDYFPDENGDRRDGVALPNVVLVQPGPFEILDSNGDGINDYTAGTDPDPARAGSRIRDGFDHTARGVISHGQVLNRTAAKDDPRVFDWTEFMARVHGAVVVKLTGPANLRVSSPAGAIGVGVDPADWMPNAVFLNPAGGSQYVVIPEASTNEYRVEVLGTGVGNYQLQTFSGAANGTIQRSHQTGGHKASTNGTATVTLERNVSLGGVAAGDIIRIEGQWTGINGSDRFRIVAIDAGIDPATGNFSSTVTVGPELPAAGNDQAWTIDGAGGPTRGPMSGAAATADGTVNLQLDPGTDLRHVQPGHTIVIPGQVSGRDGTDVFDIEAVDDVNDTLRLRQAPAAGAPLPWEIDLPPSRVRYLLQHTAADSTSSALSPPRVLARNERTAISNGLGTTLAFVSALASAGDGGGSDTEAVGSGVATTSSAVTSAEDADELSGWHQSVPIINQSLAETLPADDMLRTSLVDPLRERLAAPEPLTVDELIESMQDLSLATDGLSVTVDPATVDGDFYFTPEGDELRFDVGIEISRRILSVPIDVGASAESIGLQITSHAEVDVTASLGFEFSFGLDLGADPQDADAFFVDLHTLTAGLDVSTDSLQVDGQLGPLGIYLENGVIDVSARLPFNVSADRLTGGNLPQTPIESALSAHAPEIDVELVLPVRTDPFQFGNIAVVLSGVVTLIDGAWDYSLAADVAGNLAPGFEIVETSRITWNPRDGLGIDAHGRAFGVDLAVAGQLDPHGDFTLAASAEPFSVAGLDVGLAGSVSRTGGDLDYRLDADLDGTIAGLDLESPSTVRLDKQDGLTIDARSRVLGIGLDLSGHFHATDDFAMSLSTDEIPFPGTDDGIALAGHLARTNDAYTWGLEAAVNDWNPLPLLGPSAFSVSSLHIALSEEGIALESTATIAGIDDVHVNGDYRPADGTYRLVADAPVVWSPVPGVDVNQVTFEVSNRGPDDQLADVRLFATGDLTLFGTPFFVSATVSPDGTWLAATPTEPWSPIPGLSVERALVVASTYDFTLDTEYLREVDVPAQTVDHYRPIAAGINLVADGSLPPALPGLGSSAVQVAGTIGQSLADMSIEAKVVMQDPWVVGDVLSFDALGLRITGQPSLTLFGQGRVLHQKIPGLNQDIAVEGSLGLTPTELSGSVSLLDPVHDVFGIEGLDIVEADISVGISFVASPVPPPTIGFNFLVNLPEFATDRLNLPATLGGSLKLSNTEPILAMSVTDWRPFEGLGVGLDDVVVNEGSVVVAPNGGTIGRKVFERGISATFDIDLLGTSFHFLGAFDETTRGIVLEAYVSQFEVAGIEITGAGPDGVYDDGVDSGNDDQPDPDADNGLYFRAEVTPTAQSFDFSGRVNLPGEASSGEAAFARLSGGLSTDGIHLDGEISHWTMVPDVLVINHANFVLDVSLANPADSSLEFSGDFDLLQTNVLVAGSLSREGIALSGQLHPGSRFAGLGVEGFHFAFSTVPQQEHLYVEFLLNLPGQGGETRVRGEFRDRRLELDASIDDWQPLPTVELAGSLQADVGLKDSTLALAFDVSGAVFGSSAHMAGEVAASPEGFQLDAAGNFALRFPGGPTVASLGASVVFVSGQAFQIDVAGDFVLPGYRRGLVRLEGGLGTQGLHVQGQIDDWKLLPGLSFDGGVQVDLDFQSHELYVGVDVAADMLGSSLDLQGEVIVAAGKLEVVMDGRVEFGNAKAGLAGLSLGVHLDTTDGFDLAFDGHMRLLGVDLPVTAEFDSSSNGNWTMTVNVGMGVDVDFDLQVFDFSILDFDAEFHAGLGLRFGTGFDHVELILSGSIDVRVEVLELGSFHKRAEGSWQIDIGTGLVKIPKLRPKVHYTKICEPFGGNCVKIPYRVSWKSWNLPLVDPEPTTTVSARMVNTNPLLLGNDTLQIRGTDAPEKVEVLPTIEGGLFVRGANGGGDWVTVIEVPAGRTSALDIDMRGGDDEVWIDPRVTLPATLRGGAGSDVIRSGGGTSTIYGGRGPAAAPLIPKSAGTLAATTSSTAATMSPSSTSVHAVPLSGSVLSGSLSTTGAGTLRPGWRALQKDTGDRIYGGNAEDRVFGEGGNDIITTVNGAEVDGGSGLNVINGRLEVVGSPWSERLDVLDTGRVPTTSGTVTPGPIADVLQPGGATAVCSTCVSSDGIQATSLQLSASSGTTLQTSTAPALTSTSTSLVQTALVPTSAVVPSISDSPTVAAGPLVDSAVIDLPTTSVSLPNQAPVLPGDSVILQRRLGSGAATTLAVFPRDAVTSLFVDAGDGHDTVDIAASLEFPATVLGGPGNDTLRAGGGSTELHGGLGDDHLVGGAGWDHLLGGDGDDRLVAAHRFDTLDGGAGENTLVEVQPIALSDGRLDVLGSDYPDEVTVDENDGQVNVLLITRRESGAEIKRWARTYASGEVRKIVFHGFGGDDAFENLTVIDSEAYGGDGNDRLIGGHGNDRLIGGAGDDFIDGGSGNDGLTGDAGNDRLLGSDGNDTLSGGQGADRLEGGRHADALNGDAGNDRLSGGTGNDTLDGGDGNDSLYGESGHDRIFGRWGADYLDGGRDSDTLYGGAGNDRVVGGEHNDVLHGETGNDTLLGSNGNDILYGGYGNDYLDGGYDRARDQLFGGWGTDSFVQHYRRMYKYNWYLRQTITSWLAEDSWRDYTSLTDRSIRRYH